MLELTTASAAEDACNSWMALSIADPDVPPWRRAMHFLPCEEAPIWDLLMELAYIEDPKR